MENPMCWTPLEQTINDALADYQRDMVEGLIGHSAAFRIAKRLREAGFIVEDPKLRLAGRESVRDS